MSVAKRKIVSKPIEPPAEGPFKIRIGVGMEPGFLKIGPGADIVDRTVDLKAYPWPIDDGVVDVLYAAFYLHRIGQSERFALMNEAYRILKPGGQVMLVVPHAFSMRAISDPLAQWPPLCESSFMVYSRRWREQEGMAGLPLTCDFGDTYGYGHSLDPDVAVRNEEYQARAKKHDVNAILDLHVTLTKEP